MGFIEAVLLAVLISVLIVAATVFSMLFVILQFLVVEAYIEHEREQNDLDP